MISDTINQKIAEAMKAKDEIRLSTLRMLSSELHNARIDKRAAGPEASGPEGDLTEEEELAVVKREAKKRKDAIEAYEKAGAKDRANKEKKELEILQEFLPEGLSDEELAAMVDEALKEIEASSMDDIGKVIGAVMKKAGGRADGKKVSDLVKSKLS